MAYLHIYLLIGDFRYYTSQLHVYYIDTADKWDFQLYIVFLRRYKKESCKNLK